MKKRLIIIVSILLLGANQNFAQNITDCSICNKTLLNKEQLANKSLEELALLRNEIFARHGYTFSNTTFQNYFENKSWYNASKSNNDIQLTTIETENVNLLKSFEAKLQKQRNTLISDLKSLKKALNDNNVNSQNKFIGALMDESTDYKGVVNALKITLNKIDLNDINWNKGKGLYSVKIDNGFKISGYEIRIEEQKVVIRMGDYSHSEIFNDFNDGYSDYQSEGEYAFWWIFKITEEGIVFEEFNGAG